MHTHTYAGSARGTFHAPTVTSARAALAIALGGPLALGAVLGASGIANEFGDTTVGALDVIQSSAVLPVILLGVTAAMIPALYIATSLSGAAPPARAVGAAVLRGFRACGIALLGLLAPVAFLLATSDSHDVVAFVGAVVICGGVGAGLRALFADLYDDAKEPVTVRVVFSVWALVALAIGASMYSQFMVG